MSSFAYGCSSLTTLPVQNWNTSSLIIMNHFCYNCGRLPRIDMTGWDVSNVKNMSQAFNGCGSLIEMKFGVFDTSSVTSWSFMFGAEALTTITGTWIGIKLNLYVSGIALTRDSILVVLNGLVDVGEPRTVQFDWRNSSRITAEDRASAAAKNWTIMT